MRRLVLLLPLLLVACEPPEVLPRRAAPEAEAAPARPAAGPSAGLLAQIDALKSTLEGRDAPVDVLVAIGNLNYEAGRYVDAIDWYRRAVETAAPVIEARQALVAAGTAPAAGAPEGCRAGAFEPGRFLAGAAQARQLAGSGRRPEALACYDAVLEPVVEAMARRGAAWAILDEPARGVADAESALRLAPDHPEALYLLGVAAFRDVSPETDRERLRKVRAAWTHFLEVAPDHPRAVQVRAALVEVDQLGGAAPAGN